MATRSRSVVSDAEQVQLAAELARLGARLQVLETETSLSRERLLRLYKEVRGESPPKGMLPFSTDWFMSWMPNIHASVFINTHAYLVAHTSAKGIYAIVRAYKLYLEHVKVNELESVLSLTRAWSLVRFFDAKLLKTAACKSCGGRYVVHALGLNTEYECGLCNVPSRAGKTRKHALLQKTPTAASSRGLTHAAPTPGFLLQSLMGGSRKAPVPTDAAIAD
jgi:flagellar transcriptional activator FlhC